jgi:thioredoxin-like negative regulator of GroEL
MNEVSAKEKVFEQGIEEIETLKKTADKRAEALAEVRLLDQQIKTFDGVDWAKAQAANPGEAALGAVRLLTLQNQRKEAVQTAANIATELTKSENELLGKAREAMFDALKKDLKGWGDELGSKLTRFAEESGIKPNELVKVTNPAWVKVLNEAMAYRKLQSSKTELKAKAKDAPPVLKPGVQRVKTDGKSDAMQRLRKSNSESDAIAAFLSR